MILKSICFWVALLGFSAASLSVAAQPAPPLLVLDTRNASEFPKHFHSTSDVLSHPHDINLTGLSDLHAAGSAQFSKLELREILKYLAVKNITIIDLRQESHGFLNGNAVSWYGHANGANERKTHKQIEKDQAERLADLGQQILAVVYKIEKKSPEGDIIQANPVEFDVYRAISEMALVNKFHLDYHRFYIGDHHIPNVQTVDRFVRMTKDIPSGQWVYFHCRGGSGRTTMAMMMYDMLHNAKRVSYQDIFARQVALGGKDISKLPAPDTAKYKSIVERLNFIKKFYQYAHENNDHFKTSWSQWLKTHA